MRSKEEQAFMDSQNLKHLRWQTVIKNNCLKKHHPEIYKAQEAYLDEATTKKAMSDIQRGLVTLMIELGEDK